MKKKSISEVGFTIGNTLFLLVITVCMLYPFLYTMSVSISDPVFVTKGEILLLPKGLNLESYKVVLREPAFLRSYANTFFYSLTSTVISLLLLLVTAYPLSIKSLKGRNKVTMFFAFTMFFSGGMIPSYLVIRQLHMLDTVWAVILPGALSVWNLILCRTFLQGISESLRESASIDGANDWIILFRIIVPLATPLLAVMALYVVVGQWNNYFGPFLYLSDTKLFPLQVVLRRILAQNKILNDGSLTDPTTASRTVTATLRAAAMMVTVLPIICVYPFLQKYFVKGIMVGAIKG